MNRLKELPEKEALLTWAGCWENHNIFKVNGHIHTPYSFSAFKDIPQIFELAGQEGVKVLGINDFYTMDGYEEFGRLAYVNKVFPLFNIEFIGLNIEDQKAGLKVNDPGNPGRTYMSGKGLSVPPKLDEPYASKLAAVKAETLAQVEAMVDKTNDLFKEIGSDIQFSMEEIFENFAVDQVRERHIAKAIRVKVFEKISTSQERLAFLTKLYSGKSPSADMNNNSEVENEIRGMLLKAGGKAFVEEDPKAFLSVDEIKEIILNAGGIPTYPLLADDAKGGYTDFEQDKDVLLQKLRERNIHSVEFIPNRNGLEKLKEYAKFFWDNGILVTFGTEHNTPDLIPMTPETRGGVALDFDLQELSYNGACVVAAHQYLVANGKQGFVNSKGEISGKDLSEYVDLGHAVIGQIIC